MAKPKFIDLFEGLEKGLVDYEGGIITTSFFDTRSNYCHFETVHYESVKNIYLEDHGCIFQTDGKKAYVLYEPKEYHERHIEPTFRPDDRKIPYRFSECEIISTEKQDKVMIGKDPLFSHNSFTVARPDKANFAVYFYLQEDGKFDRVLDFYREVFRKDLRVSLRTIDKITAAINQVLLRFPDFG